MASERFHLGVERFRSSIGLPVYKIVQDSFVVICKGIDDRAKGISRQLLYLVEPLGQFRPGYIFNTLSIEYICQFHGKSVRLLQFWIEFKNNIGSPPLRRCPLGFMFREYKFGTGQSCLRVSPLACLKGMYLMSSSRHFLISSFSRSRTIQRSEMRRSSTAS